MKRQYYFGVALAVLYAVPLACQSSDRVPYSFGEDPEAGAPGSVVDIDPQKGEGGEAGAVGAAHQGGSASTTGGKGGSPAAGGRGGSESTSGGSSPGSETAGETGEAGAPETGGGCEAGSLCELAGEPCRVGNVTCDGDRARCTDTGDLQPDGFECANARVCSDGECIACEAGAECETEDPCKAGTISCSGGEEACIESGNAPDGTVCGGNMVCAAGMCGLCVDGSNCVPENPCKEGTLDCSEGEPVCVEEVDDVAPGTPCGVDAVCDASGDCSECTTGADCMPGDPCKLGQIRCNTGSPECHEEDDAPDGKVCGDNSVCSDGECVPCADGSPCTPQNKCHTGVLSCSTGSPVCNDTGSALQNGTPCGEDLVCKAGQCVTCNGGDVCTVSDVCKTGVISCETGSPVCIDGGGQPYGTPCGAAKSCSAARETEATICDGNGNCMAGSSRSCAPYPCDGDSCGTQCAPGSCSPECTVCDPVANGTVACTPDNNCGAACNAGYVQCTGCSGGCSDRKQTQTCQKGGWDFEAGNTEGFEGVSLAVTTNPAHAGSRALQSTSTRSVYVRRDPICPASSWFQPKTKTLEGWYQIRSTVPAGSKMEILISTTSGTDFTTLPLPAANTWTKFSVPVVANRQVYGFTANFTAPSDAWSGSIVIDDVNWLYTN